MIEFMKNFSVKKFIAIIVAVTFSILAIRRDIPIESVKDIILLVFSFYFTNSAVIGTVEKTKNMTEGNQK
jgi:hypothetical protein